MSVTFSPNGDGRGDVARVPFRLTAAADVTAKVKVDGDVIVRTVVLGHLDKGDHVFRWDGRTGLGQLLPDGTYRVLLIAEAGSRRDSDWSEVGVDTVNCARLKTTRRTVYPRATVVDDLVQIVLVDCEWSSWAAELGDVLQLETRLKVIDQRGKVVRDQVLHDQTTPTLTWDGRRQDGRPAPAGAYQAWVSSVDPAGNHGRFLATLRVSHEQLVERTQTYSLAAAEAGHYTPEFGGCNGCGDFCAPLSSARYPDGLSFRPCESPFLYGAHAYFAAYAPVDQAAPVDSFRVTAVGGPTTPGSTDTADLVVAETLLTTTPVGDGSTTSPWSPVLLNAHPYLPTESTPVFWSFGTTTPSSYDVASFTVEYRSYVPA